MYKNAYYIHQYQYNRPPAHVDWDMDWISSNGFNAVSIVINEIDLIKTEIGIDRVFKSAKKHGLKVHLVPARWGGILAGAVGVQSLFCIQHPEFLIYDEKGKPVVNKYWGAMASIHCPETYAFFCETIDLIFRNWDFDGIIWDEPKSFDIVDLSPCARKIRPENAGVEWDREQFAHFFDKLGKYIKDKYPNVRLSMFIYGDYTDDIFDCCCRINHLDDVGIDGNPFVPLRSTDKRRKTLIGNAFRFHKKAKSYGKNSLALLENFGMTKEENKLMEESMPEILSYGIDHLLAYYYGRNNEDPDENMEIISRFFKNC